MFFGNNAVQHSWWTLQTTQTTPSSKPCAVMVDNIPTTPTRNTRTILILQNTDNTMKAAYAIPDLDLRQT